MIKLRIWGWNCYPGFKVGPNAFTGDLEKGAKRLYVGRKRCDHGSKRLER